jgi:hypothetical protein
MELSSCISLFFYDFMLPLFAVEDGVGEGLKALGARPLGGFP